MTAASRATQFAKVHKILKKHYKPAACPTGRSVIEHLLFACCLEDSHHTAAEEAFAALVHTFFDWNEVRVTSISELSEVMACLPDPRAAANRIKRVLHAIFETRFNFDLEDLRKKNLGPTIKWFEELDGMTRFVVSYVIQAALGGHAIPIDTGSMTVLHLLDLVTDADMEAGTVPGLERAIAKSKGVEFGSILHELGADYSANAYSPKVRDILLQINPNCGSRLPKRRNDRAARKAQEISNEPEKSTKAAKTKSEKAAEKPSSRKKQAGAESSQATPPAEPSKKKSAESSKKAPSKKSSASEGLSKRKPR